MALDPADSRLGLEQTDSHPTLHLIAVTPAFDAKSALDRVVVCPSESYRHVADEAFFGSARLLPAALLFLCGWFGSRLRHGSRALIGSRSCGALHPGEHNQQDDAAFSRTIG